LPVSLFDRLYTANTRYRAYKIVAVQQSFAAWGKLFAGAKTGNLERKDIS